MHRQMTCLAAPGEIPGEFGRVEALVRNAVGFDDAELPADEPAAR
jgi:hypothetical protein